MSGQGDGYDLLLDDSIDAKWDSAVATDKKDSRGSSSSSSHRHKKHRRKRSRHRQSERIEDKSESEDEMETAVGHRESRGARRSNPDESAPSQSSLTKTPVDSDEIEQFEARLMARDMDQTKQSGLGA